MIIDTHFHAFPKKFLELVPERPDLQVKWINARGQVLHQLTIPAL